MRRSTAGQSSECFQEPIGNICWLHGYTVNLSCAISQSGIHDSAAGDCAAATNKQGGRHMPEASWRLGVGNETCGGENLGEMTKCLLHLVERRSGTVG